MELGWQSTCSGPGVFSNVLCWDTGDRLVRAGDTAVKRIETVAVHVTIGTERDGDS